ncbi:unnamed protein product [Cladocopium goreaui]|uniref:Tyrosine-protein kinase ephrin type A/B receptor-like domain-containing protein n=1 Tax=Cladocopium goreaui TaxID=2562237 RepID=A0A9P1G1P1_9DINO|nr:unnamed protein product [Cladocopium goreaui]
MAPINRGNMGYMGFITAFIPKLVQEQAYSTQGVALEFYRNWNVSWNQPWNFFSGISSVEKRNLMPCNASMMQDDPAMRRHVQFTGDTDGVVIANEKYSGRCDDGYWWLPPACRSNPSTCVPWITGGTGWSVEEFMQKFTTWNMPVAVGVAATWGDYTTLPLAGTMAFYWWSPDPTFLELSPLRVEFPEFNKREHDQGIQTSQLNAISIDTLVSRDLPVLAPMVDRFADNLEISQAQMDALLLEQKNTGDSWENVTCRWVLANRATWEKWIPDQSACFPGFGLYDTVVKDFVEMRENATNQITCQACPPGTFSQKLEDSIGTGETYICVPCGLGTSQPSGAALSCTPCKVGGYQDENRSTECKRCPFRTYQDEEGQVACKSCPASTNTLGLGSIAPSDCGCLEDQIDMDRSDNFECVACMEGMKCPALSQLVDLENGTSANGELFTPMIMEGFYTTKDSPTEVFRCRSTRTCPGGTPGTCGGGLIGTPCSQCPAGATWTGSVCEDCAGWRQALWGLAVCGVFAFLTLAYYLTSSKVTAKATVLFATTASFGMLVMSMQNLGLVGTMTVEWPEGLQALFSFCQLFLLDIDSYGFSCLAGQSEPIRYLLSALIFPVGIAWLALGYGLSRFFPEKYHWEGPKVCSTMGAFLQVGFSTMSATSLAPMMCFQHPNGLRSILKYPGVICGSADHTSMLVFAGILLVVFVFGFVALCGFAVWKVPSWSAKRRDHLVASVRFLVFRFRLDSWWFGVPLLVRGPLINLPVVLATDYPPIQVVCIAMILTTTMVTAFFVGRTSFSG